MCWKLFCDSTITKCNLILLPICFSLPSNSDDVSWEKILVSLVYLLKWDNTRDNFLSGWSKPGLFSGATEYILLPSYPTKIGQHLEKNKEKKTKNKGTLLAEIKCVLESSTDCMSWHTHLKLTSLVRKQTQNWQEAKKPWRKEGSSSTSLSKVQTGKAVCDWKQEKILEVFT